MINIEKIQDWESIKVISNSESIFFQISTENYKKFIYISKNGIMIDCVVHS